MIAKTFAYPRDARDPSKGRRLIETRILKHEPDGWVGLPYVWNEAQSEATLDVAGDTVNVSWIHTDGEPRTNNYIIPNSNQCKGCHKAGETMLPIGPKARHLNRDFAYAVGQGKPTDALEPAGRALRCARSRQTPRVSPSGTTPRPARSTPAPGPGSRSTAPIATAPMVLHATRASTCSPSQQNPTSFGINKPPVAAGLGSGGLAYDIVPGQPDRSILAYRIASTHPGVMMPELGKRLVHKEGVALVREWIAAMPPPDRPEWGNHKPAQGNALGEISQPHRKRP